MKGVGRILVAGLILLLLGTGAYAAEDVIKIGVYEPLTGQNAFGGQLTVEGIQLAHEQAPEVLGKKVELVIVDNKSDKVEAANAVKRLIERDKVVAIIGSYGSSLSMAGGEVSEQYGIPCITDSATNPLVTQGKKYYFRMCFIDPFQGSAAAKYAYEQLGVRKAAILKDVAQDYCVGLAAFFRRAFLDLGGEVVADLNYQSGDQDFTAQLTEIISKGPELLYIPSYFAEGAIIMKQARELGGNFHIMGGDAMDNPDMIKIGGEAVEGFIYTTFPYAPEMPDMNPIAQEFTKAFREKFKKEPNANAALGYDCYMLLIDCIQRAGKADPDAIRDQLEMTKDWVGVTGSTTIDESHNAIKAVGIKMVKDGQQVYVATVQPEGSK
ncbi:ABC transporter substrate-binding protein [Acetomicrobium sp. UBA5826]|uniref:ABC transporter substrate-binding protein n=1 Tax=Acetomicrobium sp. UBA5826 TaxID=1946039 RepID=UPI002579F416|nr:ABC transporter substrate-binding protein [Acetomicrobium sp. UBA5826]